MRRLNPLARPLRPPRPPLPAVRLDGDTLPAPTAGWNARDPLALMKRGDAVILDNWFPTATSCEIRGGFREHATDMGGTVESLMEWAYGGDRVLVAAANAKLWDASAPGAAVDITGSTTPQSNRWQHLNMGGYLLMFDGATTPQKFDGTTVTDNTFTGSGLTPANLIAPALFKNRLYLIEKNSLAFWYGGVDAIQGALNKVDLATVFQKGGELMGAFGWSRQAAQSALDLMCFVSSEGEILVYSGSYPADWGLVARLQGSRPIGYRFHQKIGADVAMVTINGLSSIAKLAATNERGQPEIYLSDRISSEFAASARAYKGNFGWQPLLYPQGTRLITNIPVASASSVQQYVQNTQTGAWCRFLGQQAACWTLFGDDLYFGAAGGRVFQADRGANDNGAPIVSDMLLAYDYFRARNAKKRFLNARPIIISNRSVSFAADIQTDFRDLPPTGLLVQTVSGTPWGSPWGSPWSLAGTTFQDAIGIAGEGYAGALRLRASTLNVSAELIAVGVTWEQGSWL